MADMYKLHPLDDSWVHQANLPMSMVASKDRLWLEQSWWGFWDREAGIKNAFNFWVYPNTNTVSVSFTFAIRTPDGGQKTHRLLVAREIGEDRTSMDIGPARATVVEPLREWTVSLDPTDAIPVSCDLRARAPVPPGMCAWLQGPQVENSRDPDGGSYGHFNYMCPLVWNGSLTVDGRTYDVKDWYGARDRSWGVLGLFSDVGLHLWMVASFKGFHVHVWYQELADGQVRGCKGSIIREDGQFTPIVAVSHDIEFVAGTRVPTIARFELTEPNGKRHTLVADVLNKPYCISSGTPIGKTDAESFWTPPNEPLKVVGETYDESDPDRVKVQDKVLKHRIAGYTFDGTEKGEGHFEIAVSMRSPRYRDRILGRAS